MKKLFLLFCVLFAAMDSSAIGLTEHNSFNKRRVATVGASYAKVKVKDMAETSGFKKEMVKSTKTISTSVVGLVTGFFSKVFSIFFGDYMDLSLKTGQCQKIQKC